MAGSSKEAQVEPKKTIKFLFNTPKADFIENVDEYMATPDLKGNAELAIRNLKDQLNKYEFWRISLLARKRRLSTQISASEKTMEAIQTMIEFRDKNESLQTQFLLSEQVYMKATIPATDKCLLWLGANVMMEYTLDEAVVLVRDNLEVATKSLKEIEEELLSIKDNIRTMEDNISRVHNWNILQRKLSRPSPDQIP